MTPSDVNKTSSIAKVIKCMGQVMRRLKTFRILATEMPISMIKQVDDGLTSANQFIKIKTLQQ